MPEDVGGIGGGPVEVMVIAEALGHALVVEPYVDTVVVAGGLLRRAGGELASELLERIVDGTAIVALAATEAASGDNWADVATTAERDGDEWVLHGFEDRRRRRATGHAPAGHRAHHGTESRCSLSIRLADAVDGPPLPDRRRPASVRPHLRRPAASGQRAARRGGSGVAVAGAGTRRGRGRGVLGSGRLHAKGAGRHRRIRQAAPAVRPADRRLPGACSTAWSTCTWSSSRRSPPSYLAVLKPRRRPPSAGTRGVGGQGDDRSGRRASSASRPSSCTAAWA